VAVAAIAAFCYGTRDQRKGDNLAPWRSRSSFATSCVEERRTAGCDAVTSYVGGILERILELLAHTTKREQALTQELAQLKDRLSVITTHAEAETTRADATRNVAEERLTLLTAAAALAEGRAALLAAAAARAESAEKQLGQERREHDLATQHRVRLGLRVQALKRRRDRLQAELNKFQDQLERADVSGRIRELQEQKAQLQQRVADLQTYFALRGELSTAANLVEDKQGSANDR
jgi:chromosome segregation ATPase